MEYRELGRTGIRVSATCLGAMTWSERNTGADGHAPNAFDTAEVYEVPPRTEARVRADFDGSDVKMTPDLFAAIEAIHSFLPNPCP